MLNTYIANKSNEKEDIIYNEKGLSNLPNELLIIIFNHLDIKSFVLLDLGCHFFRQFSDEKLFWQNRFEFTFLI